MVELVRQAHVEARLVGTCQIQLRLRRSIGLVYVGAGEVRLLRGGGARGMAARAEPGQQRIDRGLEARVARGGIGGELLAATRRLHGWCGQLHAGGGGGARPDPRRSEERRVGKDGKSQGCAAEEETSSGE